ELRAFLMEKLPDYMIPATFVKMASMPMTPNRKVDRGALPEPPAERPDLEESYVAPRDTVEEVLADFWKEALKLDRVGVRDGFFELGGHSLQAVQLASRISSAMGCDLSVRDIFLYPTIASLTRELRERIIAQNGAAPEKSRPEPGQGRAPGAAPVKAPPPRRPPSLEMEDQSALALFAIGRIAPVDSAAIGYLPNAKFSRPRAVRDWFDDMPVCLRIIECHPGRIAVIYIPRFENELYNDEKDLKNVIVEALRLAGCLGARVVSLTGLIPSATRYWSDAAPETGTAQDLPAVTTGHAATAAAVVMAVEKILEKSGRGPARERVGVLGLGSIGVAALLLMLKCLPHPREIILCDLYGKRDAMEKLTHRCQAEFDFRGAVRIVKSLGAPPPEFYEASLIIGAANAYDVLDIDAVKPGTLIVDDSYPHCFNSQWAIRRFEEKKDILFTEGGALKLPRPMNETRYIPRNARPGGDGSELERFLGNMRHEPFTVMSCVLAGLLSSSFEDFKPTTGFVDPGTCFRYYKKLDQLGFQAADLHCMDHDYTLPEEAIGAFRARFCE
ncbi:MAG: non-ribosomal peptide synthetase, partial [Desulfobacterales bacterium]|nr:non-ribosomal peptide synthetase [Desulfobacterales bacterium]